jgi:hypothetical protein
MMNTTPRLEGMHAATATTTDGSRRRRQRPACLFCGDPARRYKPLNEGTLTSLRKLWWCRPCETTWVALAAALAGADLIRSMRRHSYSRRDRTGSPGCSRRWWAERRHLLTPTPHRTIC